MVKNLVMVEGYDNLTKQYIVENDIDKILEEGRKLYWKQVYEGAFKYNNETYYCITE